MDDGSPMVFSGPRLHGDISRQFFDMEAYKTVMARLDAGLSLVVTRLFWVKLTNHQVLVRWWKKDSALMAAIVSADHQWISPETG